jgi:hypothetical protein
VPHRDEAKQLSLDEAASHLLEECRTIVPGVQAVFGFQLIAVFNQGFGEKLAPSEQRLHLYAIALVVLAMALVMAPAALHRMAEPKQVSERFVWLASNLVLAGMFPLAIGVGLDAYVVASVIVKNDAIGVVIAFALLVVFASLWIVLPLRQRRY